MTWFPGMYHFGKLNRAGRGGERPPNKHSILFPHLYARMRRAPRHHHRPTPASAAHIFNRSSTPVHAVACRARQCITARQTDGEEWVLLEITAMRWGWHSSGFWLMGFWFYSEVSHFIIIYLLLSRSVKQTIFLIWKKKSGNGVFNFCLKWFFSHTRKKKKKRGYSGLRVFIKKWLH